MRYEDKLRQADREARAALVGLAATIVVWAACGFGLAPSGIYVCATPLWVVAGCGGTFLFTVGVAVWMACHVMKDVGLDDEDGGAGKDAACGERDGAGGETGGGETANRAAHAGEGPRGHAPASRAGEGARP